VPTSRLTIILSIIVFLSSVSLLAQRQAAPKYRILGITVEGQNLQTGTDKNAIITNSGLKVGNEIAFPGEETRQALQRLWALRIFSDIQLLIDSKLETGVYLVIKVKEYPRLAKYELTGNDDVGEDDIKKKISLTEGQILTPDDISRVTSGIKILCEEEGHLLADVKTETRIEDSTKSNQVDLIILIDEGPRVKIKEISFTGNTAFDEDDLEDEFEDIAENRWWKFWSTPKFEKKKFEADKNRLLQFYRKNGYLDAEILSDSTWYSEDRKNIHILMNLREGEQYKIRSVRWEGNTVYKTDMLTERLGFLPGMIYDEDKFEKNLKGNEDQTDVASLYLDDGYLRFNLDPEIKRVGQDSLDITIHTYERNQFRLGHVDIKGNTKTRDNVIRRELYTRPGDFFSRAMIIRSLRQLAQLNYFNPEKIRPDTRLIDDETVDLIYEVEEKSSDNVNASVGYSGAYGVTGMLGFTINNFDLLDPLQGGAGQILNFDWQFGEGARFRTFTLSFTEPWLNERPTTLGISLYDTRQRFGWDLQQTGLSIRLGRRLTWPDNYSRADWVVRFQRNDIRDNGSSLLYDVGKSNQISLTQTLSRNSTDSPIFPTTGSSFSFSTEISGGPFLPGNVDYHKWLLSAEWYIPLFNSSRIVLYASNLFGYLDGFKKDSKIPPIEYFFMGGTGLGYVSTTILRGYEDRAVGPMNSYNQEEGGRVLHKETVELRFAVTINPIPIYLLLFSEGGNVFRDIKHADLFDLKRAYGLGARLLIQPLGMVGFDYGYGADDVFPKDGKPDGWRFHFQFGRGF
jgi:outer membrane protein insertion porin family